MGRFLSRLRLTPVALCGVAAVTLLFYRLLHVNGTTAALVLLLVVLLTSAYGTLADALVTSIASTLCLDYFFLPPVGFITLSDPEDWVALAVFFSVSLFASRLAGNFRRRGEEILAAQRETEKQYALSRSMLLGGSGEGVRRLIVNKSIELFGLREAALFESASGEFYYSQAAHTVGDEELRHVALYSGSIDHDLERELTILPISLGNKTLGSLGLCGPTLADGSLQALGNTVAIGLARAQAQEAGSRAEAIRKGEELKSILIDALAHDLKTPLTSIEAAADMLLHPTLITPDQSRDLLEVIHQEAQGLRRMMAQAIHLARIDVKRLKLDCAPHNARELIQAAVESLRDRINTHRISVDVAPELPLVSVDAELISQALKQLVDNAIKYSPSRSAIEISATESEGLLFIHVRDHGQGLTSLEQSHVFDKFYRGRQDSSAVQGTGMGLSIAKEIVEAHGGSLSVESQMNEGSQFTLTLRTLQEVDELERQPA